MATGIQTPTGGVVLSRKKDGRLLWQVLFLVAIIMAIGGTITFFFFQRGDDKETASAPAPAAPATAAPAAAPVPVAPVQLSQAIAPAVVPEDLVFKSPTDLVTYPGDLTGTTVQVSGYAAENDRVIVVNDNEHPAPGLTIKNPVHVTCSLPIKAPGLRRGDKITVQGVSKSSQWTRNNLLDNCILIK